MIISVAGSVTHHAPCSKKATLEEDSLRKTGIQSMVKIGLDPKEVS